MKKLLTVIVCTAFVISASAAYATPVGNIAQPSLLKKGLVMETEDSQYGIILTSENDMTFDRNLEDQESDTQYLFFGGKLGILFMDRFIAYGLLGAASAYQEFLISGSKVKWKTDYDLAWGVGGTALLYQHKFEELWNGIFSFGVDGRYRQSDLSVKDVIGDTKDFNVVSNPPTSNKYNMEEWQVAAAVAYQIDWFCPYFGVKYSDTTGDAKTTANGTQYKVDLKAKDNVGIFVGGDIVINETASLNVEGRFIDETALSAGASVRF